MCQIWLRSDRRECNAGMAIAKCTKTAASSNVSNHLSRTPAAWCASGAAHHARPYRNLGRRISLRSYTIVDVLLISTTLFSHSVARWRQLLLSSVTRWRLIYPHVYAVIEHISLRCLYTMVGSPYEILVWSLV